MVLLLIHVHVVALPFLLLLLLGLRLQSGEGGFIDVHAVLILVLVGVDGELVQHLADGIGVLGRRGAGFEEVEAFLDLCAESLSELGGGVFCGFFL